MKKIQLSNNPAMTTDSIFDAINLTDNESCSRFILYCSKSMILRAIKISEEINNSYKNSIVIIPDMILSSGKHYWELLNRDAVIFSNGDGSSNN